MRMHLKKLLLFVCSFGTLVVAKSSTIDPIDVVFVCHEKDLRTLDYAIAGIKENGANIGRIIVVSSQKLTDHAEWFDEAAYPFSKKDLMQAVFRGNEELAERFLEKEPLQTGWIYQQLLKLYAPFVIPDISPNVLVVDADTVFMRNVEFIDSEGFALYNASQEGISPAYLEHGARLLPGFKQALPGYAGIAHHILLQRPILQELFAAITAVHTTEPWKAICQCIDLQRVRFPCLSEYEIYFNYIFSHKKQVKLRLLKFTNKGGLEKTDLPRLDDYDYVSFHSLNRTWLANLQSSDGSFSPGETEKIPTDEENEAKTRIFMKTIPDHLLDS